MRAILVLLLVHAACVAAEPAPWDRVPTALAGQVAQLVRAEAVLQRKAKDPAALDEAIVALCAMTLPDPDGSGTWPLLRRARAYADRRHAARARPAGDLGDCWAELWCRTCTGDGAKALAEVERLDPAGAHPVAVALRLAATRDHRAWSGKPWPGGFLGLTLQQALLATGCVDGGPDEPLPVTDPQPPGLALKLLEHPSLAAAAPALRRELAAAYRVPEAALAAAVAGERDPQQIPSRVLSALWRWSRGVESADPADSSGSVQASDLAAWIGMASLDSFARLAFVHGQEILRLDKAGDLLPAVWNLQFRLEGQDVGPLPVMAERVLDAGGIDLTTHLLLACHVTRLNGPGHPAGPRQLCRAIARWRREPAADRDPFALEPLTRTGAWLGQLRGLRGEIAAALERDPWNGQLALAAALANEAIALPDRAADAEWSPERIDGTAEAAAAAAGGDVAVLWEGAVVIEEPGEVSFLIESAGATELTVGDQTMQLGANKHVRERTLTVALAAGEHPLRIALADRGAAPVCTLRWRRGDGEPSPVPAAALRGVRARAWALAGAETARCHPSYAGALAVLRDKPWWPRVARRLALSSQPTCHEEVMEPAFRVAVAPGRGAARLSAPDLMHLLLPRANDLTADERRDVYRCFGLEPHQMWLPDIAQLLGMVERTGEWQLFFDDVGDWTRANGSGTSGLISALAHWHVGRFAESVDRTEAAFDLMRQFGVRRAHGLPLEYQRAIRLLTVPFARMHGRPVPSLTAVREEMTHFKARPSTLNSLAFLFDERSREEALAAAATVEDGDEVLLYLALDALAHGQHDQARADLRELVELHPRWVEAGQARSVLGWYARQTPETLAALPRDPSQRRVAVVPIPPRTVPGGGAGPARDEPMVPAPPAPPVNDF
jgi:tetratricopeptide (TPR) repeat protein